MIYSGPLGGVERPRRVVRFPPLIHPAGDLDLGVAGGKQRAGLHADVFERLAITQATGVAAVGGWSHAAMLPGQGRQRSPKRAGCRS
jgi:hypothetical protein